MQLKKTVLPGWALFFLKGLVVLFTFYFLYDALLTDNSRPETWVMSFLDILSKGEGAPILAAIGLVFFNYALEAQKWKILASKIEKLKFWPAYRAVLVGICLGFITPNRLGDYAGRILALHSRKRLQALGAVFLGRFCQLTVTVALGAVGLYYFLISFYNLAPPILISIAASLLFVIFLFGLLFFRPHIFISVITAIPFLIRYTQFVSILSLYTPAELKKLLQLSVWRYLVFLTQFILLLKGFGVPVTWWQMAFGVSGTFLLKSVVPSLSALSDLGMRELSAIYFFSLLGQTKLLIMSASLSLWFINIALPSLIGLLYVWQVKWQVITKRKKLQRAGKR